MILDEKQSYIDEAKKAQDFLKKRRAEFKKKDKINKLKLEMKIKKKLKEKLLKVVYFNLIFFIFGFDLIT